MKLSEQISEWSKANLGEDYVDVRIVIMFADMVSQLESENEALWKFFHAGGDHDWSCDSTHGTGLPCDCGFQEVLDALLTE